jgi:hypothetical protein
MNYRITFNLFPDNSFDLSSWNLLHKNESERISVQKDGKEYSMVFSDEFRLEIWSLDANGELNELEETKYLANPNVFI